MFLVIFYAWQMYLLLSQEEKDEDPPETATASAAPGISSLAPCPVQRWGRNVG